jgi:peptidoglycan-associated lipoprotein
MTSKMLPALCAALLLAACGSDASKTSETPPSQIAGMNNPTGGVDGTVTETNPQDALQSIGNTVYFDTDSVNLTAQAQATLQKQAAWMLQNRQLGITVEGHADERGTREYNLALGERRAQAVLNYLSALGVDSARLKEISYGKEKPICADSGETCWSQNRRGVTTLDN